MPNDSLTYNGKTLTTPEEKLGAVATELQSRLKAGSAEPTMSDIYKTADISYGDTAFDKEYENLGDLYRTAANTEVDERAIYRSRLDQYQKEIDAVNDIYREQLNTARREGEGRVGSTTAMGARAGILGSDFGAAQKEQTLGYNREIENAIGAEQAAKIGAIMGAVRREAADEAAQKRQAKMQGAEKYLEYLAGRTERQQARLSNIAAQLIQQGVDPSELDPRELQNIATEIGVNPQDLVWSFQQAKSAADAAAEEANWKREGEQLNRDKIRYDMDLAERKFQQDAREFGMEYALKERAQGLAEAKAAAEKDAATASGSPDNVRHQLEFLKSTAEKAKALAAAAGPSGINKRLGDAFVGDTQFRQLEAQIDTLKTNLLTLTTDPNIRKFFGPQMSNADVRLMGSAATTLDAERNSPAQVAAELDRVIEIFTRLETAASAFQAPDGRQIILTD